jgi:PAS domain-containing protein
MKLEVLRGPKVGVTFTLQPGENTAGRTDDNHIHLPSSHVSGRHCAFVWQGGQLLVSDRGSTNGVYVEGHKVREAVITAGQRVQVGDWLLLVVDTASAVPQRPPPGDRSITRPNPLSGPPLGQPVPSPGAPAPSVPPPPASAPPPPASAPPPPASAPPPPASAPPSPASAPPPPASPTGFGVPQASSGGFGQPSPVPPSAEPEPPAFGGAASGAFTAGIGGFGGLAPEPEPEPVDDNLTVTRDVPEAGGPRPPAQPSVGFGAPSGGFGGSGFGEPEAPPSDPAFGDPPSYGGISPASDRAALDEPADDLAGKVKLVWRRVRKLPWSIQLAAIMLLACLAFLLAPGGGVISQVLNARNVAEQQVLERAKALSLALSARNVEAIAKQNNLALDANFLLGEPGVKVSMLTDQRGVVRAPPEKVRQSIGGKDYFDVATERGSVSVWRKGGGQWHVLAPIRVAHVDGAPASIMGWAYLLYDVDAAVDESSPVFGRFIAALVVLFGILGATGLSIWRLSTAPIKAVREELELAMRGHVGQVAVPTEWRHLRDLTHSINRLLDRWKRGGGERGGDAAGMDPALLASALGEVPVPVFLVRSDLVVLGVSQAACAWLGAQPDALVGRGVAELLPDEAFLDTLRATCAQVAGGEPPTAAASGQLGANRVAVRALNAGQAGVVAIVAVG